MEELKQLKILKDHLKIVDGAMIGRAIYHSPYFLADIEKEIFNNDNVPTRSEVMEKLIPYIQEQTSKGSSIKSYYETYSWIISWTKWIKNMETISI